MAVRVPASIRSKARQTVNWVGTVALSPPRTCFGAMVNHGPRDTARVALTFDDGPSSPCTDWTLDALDAVGVKATFFVVGTSVRHYPELVQRADAEGHVIGSHTEAHRRRPPLFPGDAAHLELADRAIGDAIGRLPALYRPPWGWLTPWEAKRAQRLGMKPIGWDVYPPDWTSPETPAAALTSFVCERVGNGSIVLLHDAGALTTDCAKTETARAVPQIVGRLRDQGFEFVTIPELLQVPAYRADAALVAA